MHRTSLCKCGFSTWRHRKHLHSVLVTFAAVSSAFVCKVEIPQWFHPQKSTWIIRALPVYDQSLMLVSNFFDKPVLPRSRSLVRPLSTTDQESLVENFLPAWAAESGPTSHFEVLLPSGLCFIPSIKARGYHEINLRLLLFYFRHTDFVQPTWRIGPI